MELLRNGIVDRYEEVSTSMLEGGDVLYIKGVRSVSPEQGGYFHRSRRRERMTKQENVLVTFMKA